MKQNEISSREISERDLLIELKTKVEALQEDFKEFRRCIDNSTKKYDDLSKDVINLKSQVEENTKLRNWVYGAIITGGLSLIGSIIRVANEIK